ncbi:hypothetical protein AOLI_G00002650 [Acnodon oligacanthus]
MDYNGYFSKVYQACLQEEATKMPEELEIATGDGEKAHLLEKMKKLEGSMAWGTSGSRAKERMQSWSCIWKLRKESKCLCLTTSFLLAVVTIPTSTNSISQNKINKIELWIHHGSDRRTKSVFPADVRAQIGEDVQEGSTERDGRGTEERKTREVCKNSGRWRGTN